MKLNLYTSLFCALVAAIPQGTTLGHIAGGLCGFMAVWHAFAAGRRSV